MKYTPTILLLCLYFCGCTRLPEKPDGMPELTPCRIVVSFGGEKLAGVSVLLQPLDPKMKSWPAGGQTDEQGRAVLKTAAYYEGVVPGDYIVSFQKNAEPELRPDDMPLPAKSLVPLKYQRHNSEETLTVTKDKTEYVFDLEGV